MEVGKGADALGVFLTGGASNSNPDASLGGVMSGVRNRGLGPIFGLKIPGLRIDNVYPASGEGDAYLYLSPDGEVIYVPPDGLEGEAVAINEGESKVVTGEDPDKAVRIFREAGLGFPPGKRMDAKLVTALNGALAHGNVSSAQRVAGVTTYRAIMLYGQGSVSNIRLWLPPVAGAQATFALALENAVGGAIQTIASETTAPVGVSFSTPTTEAAALRVSSLSQGGAVGLWIRRVFPAAGAVDPRENVQLAMAFRGGT